MFGSSEIGGPGHHMIHCVLKARFSCRYHGKAKGDVLDRLF